MTPTPPRHHHRPQAARRGLGLLLCAALAGTAGAQAGDASGAPQRLRNELDKRFAAADRNGDGLLSREEAQQGMPMVYRSFDAIDEARTGQLSPAQISAWALRQRQRR